MVGGETLPMTLSMGILGQRFTNKQSENLYMYTSHN